MKFFKLFIPRLLKSLKREPAREKICQETVLLRPAAAVGAVVGASQPRATNPVTGQTIYDPKCRESTSGVVTRLGLLKIGLLKESQVVWGHFIYNGIVRN